MLGLGSVVDLIISLLCRLDSSHQAEKAAVVASLESQLKILQGDISALNAAHSRMVNTTKDCCRNDSAIALLVRNAIKDYLAGVSTQISLAKS